MFVRASCHSVVFAFVCVLFASVTFVTHDAYAESVMLEPVRDNTIFTDGVDAPADLSNGAGPHIFVGRTLFAGLRRGLIAFDIAGNIPAGSTIDEVILTMHMSLGTSGSTPYTLHRVQSDWGEGTSDSGTGSIGSGAGGGMGAPATPSDATWMHSFFDTQPWSNVGGDFDATPSGSTMVGPSNGDYDWESTPELVADVQAWLDAPSTNFGWLIKNDEPPAPTGRAKRFDSRENANPSFRPRLRIAFTPPPPLQEVTLDAIKDNTIIADDFLNPQELSNGAGWHIFSGKTLFAGPRRGLLAFDVASNVPPNATIVEAELILHMSLGTQGTFDFALHRLLSDWGEGTSDSGSGGIGSGAGGGMGAPATPGDATWEYSFYPDQSWGQMGGDFATIESAITSVGGAQDHYAWGSTPGMVADVQSWADDPSTNYGWMILGIVPAGATRTAKRFDSREHPNASFHPQLVIRYSASPMGCATCDGDIDGSGIVNGADIHGFVHCLLTGGQMGMGCACADMDGDTTLSISDVSEFADAVIQTIDCGAP